MHDRIKKLRKALGLTQQEFSDRIGSKRTTIAKYETETNVPSSAVISLICREFNVNENWLRYGEGEMFVKRSRNDELSAFVDELMKEQPQDFRRRLVTALSRLKPEQWDALEAIALELPKEPAAQAFAPAPVDMRIRAEKPVSEWTEAEIEADVAEYRRELLEEKRRAESGSASSGSGETRLA